jgi:8-oxo-dGTP diphosphatase
MKYTDINWEVWVASEQAALMLIIREGRMLLILKKRGLGAGKFNGPGGRIEAGETPVQAAVREVEEEIGVTPVNARQAGQLYFQFVDGHSIHGYVFTASNFSGELRETDEALPFWVPLDRIPYHNMWADDRLWIPLLLAGKLFVGRFLFDGDQMLGGELDLVAET